MLINEAQTEEKFGILNEKIQNNNEETSIDDRPDSIWFPKRMPIDTPTKLNENLKFRRFFVKKNVKPLEKSSNNKCQ